MNEIRFFGTLSSQRYAPHNAHMHPIRDEQRKNTRHFISIGNKVNRVSLKSVTRAGEHHQSRCDQNMTTDNFKIIYLSFIFFNLKHEAY